MSRTPVKLQLTSLKAYPYWWDSPGLSPRGSEPGARVLPARVDVAIVGGGYTGLSAARELARRGASVIVVEREHAGWGASSRNAGQVLTGLKLDPATLVARFGEARARHLFDASLQSIAALEELIAEEAIECEYERTGHILAAAKPSHFEGFRDEQALLASVFNHRVELLPASDQQREVDSRAYFGLMVDERSAAINPARYADGLAAAARRAGAAIVEDTSVTRLRRWGGRWEVETDHGTVESREVLVATDGYTTAVAPWLRRRLVPIGSYVIATEPLSADDASALLPKRRMAFDSKNFLHYFRVMRDRRLLFGGRAEFSRPTAGTTMRCAEILRRDMLAIFPRLELARIEYVWSGNVAFSRDQLPHAGRLDGAYYASGYCGHGVAMATFLGAQIGRRIAGDSSELFFDDPLPTIPLYRGAPWFLPIVGAYYALRDWLD